MGGGCNVAVGVHRQGDNLFVFYNSVCSKLIFPDCLILPLWSVRYRFLNHNEPQRESLSR